MVRLAALLATLVGTLFLPSSALADSASVDSVSDAGNAS